MWAIRILRANQPTSVRHIIENLAMTLDANYRIGLATAQHIDAIPVIEQSAAAIFPEADLPLGLRYRVTDKTTLRSAQARDRLWTAIDNNDHVVGFAMVTEIDGNAHLDEMHVIPQHGRRGIGTRLAQIVVDWSRRQGYDAVTLVTFRHLPWNGPFYAGLGFSLVATNHLGPEIQALLHLEAAAGINIAKRQVMIMELQ